MSNNIIDPVIANLYFIDEANYDYHLISNSSAVNAGTTVNSIAGHSLSPDSTYEHPTSFGLRIASSIIDAGAYEYNPPSSISEISINKPSLYPNPFIHSITLKDVRLDKSEIALFSLLGQDF